jgi:hypothetical protein
MFNAPAARAQDAPRPYDQGPVWEITHIQTKPGHFEDYMKVVAGPWRRTQEALKKVGAVVDYKVLNLADARDGEADLILLVEWKNMGVFDASLADQDSITKQVFGSTSAADQGAVDREAIRHIGSDILTRELVLKPAR